MENKKVGYIILLIVLVIGIGAFAYITVNRTERLDVTSSNNTNLGNKEGENAQVVNSDGKIKTTVTTLDDGVLYSLSDKDTKADIVIGDNRFDTQISDINLNISEYDGKTIEIEGMSLTNDPYTFVGRYSTVNLCPYCPAGYSYLEYEWKGDKTPQLKEEESWLKIKGTIKKGLDNGAEYCYIDVSSLEVMNEKGQMTVNN